jgi:hypothetical protein
MSESNLITATMNWKYTEQFVAMQSGFHHTIKKHVVVGHIFKGCRHIVRE